MKQNTNRLNRFQSELAEIKIDCAMIGPTTNMEYLLGGTPHADERLCLLLVTPDRAQIIAPELNADSIAAFTNVEMITWADADGPAAAISHSILSGRGGKTLAADGSMRADFLLTVLNSADPSGEPPGNRVKFTAVDPIVSRLRILKSPEEISAMDAAAAQADRAMQAAVDACEPGATEAEVAWRTEQAFRLDGADNVEFTLIAAGRNAAMPHHHSGHTVLQSGQGIIIDIGASLNGYKSDITRVVFLGEPDNDFITAYDTVRKANTEGRNAVKPGVKAEEVDRAARGIIDEAGLGEFFIHRTGHGLGLDIHEPPWIQEYDGRLLEPGMVFSVEPGVYLPEKFGIRIEDIVTVTGSGVRTLTGFNHDLVIK